MFIFFLSIIFDYRMFSVSLADKSSYQYICILIIMTSTSLYRLLGNVMLFIKDLSQSAVWSDVIQASVSGCSRLQLVERNYSCLQPTSSPACSRRDPVRLSLPAHAWRQRQSAAVGSTSDRKLTGMHRATIAGGQFCAVLRRICTSRTSL